MTKDEIILAHKEFLFPAVFHYYKEPLVIARAKNQYVWDADGNQYLDYVGSWGPLILGHAHPAVVEAIEKANRDGASFGACTPREAELAEQVIGAFPSIEKIRFVSSGTEATMSAIRLAPWSWVKRATGSPLGSSSP